jgi:hypothetical protein
MRDVKQYWQEVRALERSLPEFVWLMSVADSKRGMVGGRIAQVGAAQAAQLLHAKAYRLATDDEIAAHLESEDRTRRQSFHAGLRRKGIAVVAVPTAPAADSKRAPTRRR